MPRSPKGTSFAEFIKQQLEVNKPTTKETLWSTGNFSSRVDPPIDEVDGGGEDPGGGGDPGGNTPVTCVAPTQGATDNMPGRLTAHLAVLTTNLDPTVATVTSATEWGVRGQPMTQGVQRPARMFPVNLATLASGGKGGFMVFRNVTSWGGDLPSITFDTANVQALDGDTNYGRICRLQAFAGSPAKLLMPNEGSFGLVPADVVLLESTGFNVPSGDVTHVMWAKFGATTFVYRNAESGYNEGLDTYLEAYDFTTAFTVLYACYSADGTELYRQVRTDSVTYRGYFDEGLTAEPGPSLTGSLTGVANRKVISHGSFATQSHIMAGVSTDPLPAMWPRLTHWPLMIGQENDCLSDFTSLTANTLLLSEAASQPSGNGGSIGVGYNIALNHVDSMATVRFYPNRQDALATSIPNVAEEKQAFLCHSTTPTTGVGGGSPSLTSTPIPSSIALLRKTPVIESDIVVHGAGSNAHLSLAITSENWGNGTVYGGGSTNYPYLKLTFRYMG